MVARQGTERQGDKGESAPQSKVLRTPALTSICAIPCHASLPAMHSGRQWLEPTPLVDLRLAEWRLKCRRYDWLGSLVTR